MDYLENWEGDDLTVLEFNEIVRIYQRLLARKESGWLDKICANF